MRTLTQCIVLGLLPMAAQGEIITGDIVRSSNRVTLSGLPIGLQFTGWSHNDVSYSDLDWNSASTQHRGRFLAHPIHDLQYTIGDVVAPGHEERTYIYWGSSQSGGSYIGTVGQTFFLGFTFIQERGGGLDERVYGFIQIEKLSQTSYDWIGYAYNNEHGQTIETFDLIPSPSGLAVFGVGGLLAARRRR